MTDAPHAADLIAQAQAATTAEQIDAIEAQAAGRVTVLDAVEQARTRLFMEQRQQGEPMPDPPVVDPSPTAAPIYADPRGYDEVLAAYPAAASPPEILELTPNNDPPSGPDAQISPTTYVHMTKPDGSEFLAPLSNVPAYEAKGFTAGAEEEIEDIGAYWAAKSKEPPPAPPEPEQPAT